MSPEDMARIVAQVLTDQPMSMQDIALIRQAEVQLVGEKINIVCWPKSGETKSFTLEVR